MCLCSCIGIYFIAAFLGFEWAGLQSLVADGPFLSRWLELEVFLFALVFLVSAVMALFYAPLGVFAQMQASSSTSELERRVRSHVNKGAVFTIILFLLLASLAYLRMIKPV